MADIVQFKTFIDDLQTWMEKVSTANSDQSIQRPWCVLKIDKSITDAELETYFDRSTINTEYATQYTKNPLQGQSAGYPFAFLQLEADLIYSMQKSFNLRHRPRLMNYRDDCAGKNYHNYSAISLSMAKYSTIKQGQAPSK